MCRLAPCKGPSLQLSTCTTVVSVLQGQHNIRHCLSWLVLLGLVIASSFKWYLFSGLKPQSLPKAPHIINIAFLDEMLLVYFTLLKKPQGYSFPVFSFFFLVTTFAFSFLFLRKNFNPWRYDVNLYQARVQYKAMGSTIGGNKNGEGEN